MNLKRTISIGALAALLFAAITPVASVQAAGGVLWPSIRLAANKSSAIANGSDTITITATVFAYECNNVNSYDGKHYVYDSVDGCNKYAGGVKGEISYPGTVPDDITVTLNVEGEGVALSKNTIRANGDTIAVKSSAAGSKNIKATASWPYNSGTRTSNTLTFNFTTPPPPAPKPKAAAPKPAPEPVVEKPAAPTVATIVVDDKEIKAGEEVSLTVSQPLLLAGKTVPNGKVAVWVFSEPKLFETTADKDGNWSVTVAGLPEGSHHAEVEVTNPANNQKSERAKLLDFKVVADKKPEPAIAATTTTRPQSKTGLWVGIILGVLVLAAGVTAFLWWKRKQKAKNQTPTSPTETNLSSGPDSTTPTDGASDSSVDSSSN